MFISWLASRGERQAEKHKNDASLNFDADPLRLQSIMHQLSPADQTYLKQYLTARKLGVSDDGELMSLNDLLAEDDDQQSLFTG
jgi:hypothetical protein